MTDRTDITAKSSAIRNQRLVIALLLAAIIAVVFWSTSRVPALNEKAQMGLRTNVSSLAFDILLPVADDQSFVERVGKNTVNWLYTNWKGMTFGLLFAAAALTILGSIRRRSFSNPLLNTLSGMFFGAPLGVCVNCATPIAQGMYAAGARLETALATLISSPTLNPIVLGMMFTLLPWEMAAGNLIAVGLLLGALPWLARKFGVPEMSRQIQSSDVAGKTGAKLPPAMAYFAGSESWLDAAHATTSGFSRNLLYIVALAVPLMLLAGLLGAIAIELAPFDLLSDLAPGVLLLLLTAVIATFLPVPMAFNVIVVMALLSRGMHPGIGTVLLFSLGVFSIYPATIIARFVSVRLSVALATGVVIIATTLGLASTAYFDQKQEQSEQAIVAGLIESRQSVRREAIAVCNSVSRDLQLRCFADSINEFLDLAAQDRICDLRPAAVDRFACRQLVDLTVAQQAALDTGTAKPCAALETGSSRNRCNQYFVLRSAVSNHDIALCEQLSNERSMQECRVQYLNASLLFNPDDSVCRGLQDNEKFTCEVNAKIYRLADTQNFSGCNELPADAREHCRWITATTAIGRGYDASGCAELETPALAARCREHVTAWRATADLSPGLCDSITTAALSQTCKLRVAKRRIGEITANFSLDVPSDAVLAEPDDAISGTESARSVSAAPALNWEIVVDDAEYEIARSRHRNRGGSSGNRLFAKNSGREFGIDRSWQFNDTDFFEPFIIGKGIASGDFNNDGWPDLVLASESGAILYANTGGRFQRITVPQGDLQDSNLFLVALVDADGDGQQDLFASTYDNGNYLLFNRGDGFTETELIRLDGDYRLTLSAAFGDLDLDGDVDIALGNWSSGVEKLFSPETSGNAILYRDSDSYRVAPLNDVKGETNSVLMADINNDGRPDLLFGNDRTIPDVYYLGTADRELETVTRDSGIVPVTSMFTMSLDTADFNNDLKTDLFSTDMTFARSSSNDYCEAIIEDDARMQCYDSLRQFENFSSGSATQCSAQGSQRAARECYVAFSIKAAKNLKDNQYCENVPAQASHLKSLCEYVAAPLVPEERIDPDRFPVQKQRNVLLMNDGSQYVDVSEQNGVDSSYWSWNAKTADLDNDGWQDIYIGNGFHFGDSFYEVQPNVLFRNLEGDGFEEVAADWGVDDRINTPSYTYVDFDLDGDLDIIATGVLAPPRVFVNEQASNNSISFSLQQENANTSAIGANITISYGNYGNLQQTREIKMSGGFLSFDSPVAHFGLGDYSNIDSITVRWPDGHESSYNQALDAGNHYRIQRK